MANSDNTEKNKESKKPPRNPNKRPCIATSITFSVQKENMELLRILSKKYKTR